jgi:pyruvate-formate lyase-activating enzyme
MRTELIPSNYYRLPWSLNDNVLAWLEPTKRCNLYCEGCYSRNEKGSDKSIEQIRSDLDVFTRNRRVDSISIAGGDPLVHPDIVEIVRIIREEYGLKPVLNTNGHALTPELLRELKRAGAFGFTFHIDSSQSRPNWKGKNDLELNELRLFFARMLNEVGGLSANFNSTVFPHTLEHVPGMIEWARENIDIVHNMVFILFRTTHTSTFDYFAKGEKIDPQTLVYYDEDKNPEPLSARQVVAKIREYDPEFDPCAYLGGTKDPNSFKWLVTARIGDKERIYGYAGKRFMEMAQSGHHFFAGRYLAYSHPDSLKHGRSLLLGLSAIDTGFRKGAKRFVSSVLRSPSRLRSRLHMQSIVIIQPIDMQADGETNMCDGCPDMTVHNGKLVWSCRLDEVLQFGCFLTTAPKRAGVEKIESPLQREQSEIERQEIQAQASA